MIGRGWRVEESIALELDAALYIVLGQPGDGLAIERLPGPAADLRAAVSDDWRAAWREHLGAWDNWGFQVGRLALLADCLFDVQYSRATLAMRALDVHTALERATALTADLALGPPTGDTPLASLLTLLRAAEHGSYDDIGLSDYGARVLGQRLERELEQLTLLLTDTERRGVFWHLLDRFYFEAYAPWRASRAEAMAAITERAVSQLGARAGEAPPATAWLPPQNPLVNHPELGRAVAEGRQAVVFWIEPLALFDAILVVPGMVLVTVAEPGALFEVFDAQAVALADRVKALADPTRLKMLRLIRHLTLDNTQIASYLDVARPTVSIHAQQLRTAGLIASRQEGRQARHTLQPEAVGALFADLAAFLGIPPEVDNPPEPAAVELQDPSPGTPQVKPSSAD